MKARLQYKHLLCAVISIGMLVAVPACQRSPRDFGDVYAAAATVKRATVATVVQMAGQVVAVNSLELDFGVMGGRLVDIAVQTGQEVQAGQELMHLETAGLERVRREAEADLSAAEAGLVAALKGAGPGELARADAELSIAAYGVDAAKLALDLVEKEGVQYLRYAVEDAEVALRVVRDELRLREIGEGQPTIRALEYDVAFFQRLLRDLAAGDPERTEALNSLADREDSLSRARQSREDALSAARDVVEDKDHTLALAQENLARALSGADDPSNSARLAHRAAVEALNMAQRKVDALRAGGESEAVEAARTAYEAAQAALQAAQAALQAATLRAPFEGTAVAIYVSPNDAVGPGQKVMFLADFRELRLDAQVSELDVSRIQLGQDVRVSFDVYPGQLFSGTVLELPQQATNQSGITYYRVIMSLDPGDATVWLGMYANARVIVGERQDVLTMPAAAVRYDEMGERYVILRHADNAVENRKVQLGMNDGILVEVLSGLSEGDTVLLPLIPATDYHGGKGVLYR